MADPIKPVGADYANQMVPTWFENVPPDLGSVWRQTLLLPDI